MNHEQVRRPAQLSRAKRASHGNTRELRSIVDPEGNYLCVVPLEDEEHPQPGELEKCWAQADRIADALNRADALQARVSQLEYDLDELGAKWEIERDSLTRERERMLEDLEHDRATMDAAIRAARDATAVAVQDTLNTLREAERLRTALRQHGQHHLTCATRRSLACNCGLTASLEAAGASPQKDSVVTKEEYWCSVNRAVALRTALRDLARKVEQVATSPEMKAVFDLAAAHGVPYTGPHYGAEMEAARVVLAAGTQSLAAEPDEAVWAIMFEDPDRPHEIFMGKDAEQAARARHSQQLGSWNCHLMREEVGTSQPQETK